MCTLRSTAGAVIDELEVNLATQQIVLQGNLATNPGIPGATVRCTADDLLFIKRAELRALQVDSLE